jgi:hypothetical protein
MQLNRTKWVVMTVVFCFAILQALQPFIHAHLDDGHHTHGEGLHMAETHESSHVINHLSSNSISDAGHDHHSIAVPSGIKQDNAADLMMDVLAFVLVSFWFVAAIRSGRNRFPQSSFISSYPLTRRLPAPRAPPLF